MDLMSQWQQSEMFSQGLNPQEDVRNIEDENPIFKTTRVDFEPPHEICSLVTSNNTLIMGFTNSHIIRLNLADAEELEDIEISKKPNQIRELFLDPTGNHLVIASVSDENYYIHSSWKKPKLLSKLKGESITAIAWDKNNRDTMATHAFLVGTATGQIIETSIEAKDHFFVAGKEKYAKTLHTIPPDNRGKVWPITGLYWERYAQQGTSVDLLGPVSTSDGVPEPSQKIVVFASTARIIHQFIGGPAFETLFAKYEQMPGYQLEPPEGPLDYSSLHIFAKKIKEGVPPLPALACLMGPGIFRGDIMFSAHVDSPTGLLSDTNLVALEQITVKENVPEVKSTNTNTRDGGLNRGIAQIGDVFAGSGVNNNNQRRGQPQATLQLPLAMCVSAFHFLLLFQNKVTAVSTLNTETQWEHVFRTFDNKPLKMKGLARDPMHGVTFVYSANHVFELHVSDEDRNVWKMYLQKKQFDAAISFCKEPWQRDIVYTAQAEHAFNSKQYEDAATFYAKTTKSFEEITLKFIHIGQRDALRTFLKQKLNFIKTREVTQLTIICTWLTEMYLNKLNDLETNNNLNAMRAIEEEFKDFMVRYHEFMNPSTTFNLMSSHGRTNSLLFYANLIKDTERVLVHHINQNRYKEAIEVLKQRENELKDPSSHGIYYKYASALLVHEPNLTTGLLIRSPWLEPRLLLPAWMHYQQQQQLSRKAPIGFKATSAAKGNNIDLNVQENHAVKYFEWAVTRLKSTDMAVHNYLLSLYVELTDQAPLISFIKQRDTYFDLEYALRLCTKYNKTHACVLLYSKMGMYEEAVDLALKVDIELARQNANMPEDDIELRKKLWLRIARHVVEEEKNIKKAMNVLKDCDLLKIEDILPFFPDFVLIDDFKEEICDSLEDYNKHIEDLKSEMVSATNSAELIRKDIKDLRNKYGFVTGAQKCEVCRYPVLTRSFYLFPCQHVFHTTCLVDEISKHLDAVKLRRLQELQRRVKELATVQDNANMPAGTMNGLSEDDQVREEFDRVVAAECILCGDVIIKSIVKPFISADDVDLKSWEI